MSDMFRREYGEDMPDGWHVEDEDIDRYWYDDDPFDEASMWLAQYDRETDIVWQEP